MNEMTSTPTSRSKAPTSPPRWEAAVVAAILLLAAGFVGYFLGTRSQTRAETRSETRSDQRAAAATGAPSLGGALRDIRLAAVRVLPSEDGGRADGGSRGPASLFEGLRVTNAPATQVALQRVNLPGVRNKVEEEARLRLREGGVPLAPLPPMEQLGWLTLDLDVRGAGPGVIRFQVAAWLDRPVYLTPESDSAQLATVWREETVGVVPRKDAPAAVRAAAAQLMANFVQRYQVTNSPNAKKPE
jgi:hypothetical protein